MNDDYGFGNESEQNDFMYFKHQGALANKFSVGKGEGASEVVFKHFLWDLDSIKTGWMWIQMDMAPVIVWNDAPKVWKANPGQSQEEMERYKKGFNVDVFIKDQGIKTWSSSSWGGGMAFGELMKTIDAQREINAGKYPVIQFDGHEIIQFKTGGSSSIPKLSLVKWVESDEFKITGDGIYEEPAPIPQAPPVQETMSEEDIPF
jgi:hypothetical protein